MSSDHLNHGPGDAESGAVRARDRILLYLRGLDLPPLLSLELALEALRRVEALGAAQDPARTMHELHDLLRERSLHPELTEAETRLSSTPPLNRRSMIAEDGSLLRRLRRRPDRGTPPVGAP